MFAIGVAAWASVALENARLYRSLQDANRLKDEFLATLSHELRTPLNAILGYARMLRSGMLATDRQPRAVETIERNAESLTQIVEDVLDVSRIIAGKMRLNLQPVDMADVVGRAVEGIQPSAELKGITIHTSFAPNLEPVSGDPERIQQIAWNLLSNAVKFTNGGGEIVVTVGRSGASVSLQVRDTGVGIPPEFLPHLFERFRQADAGTTRVHGGLGLGLAIVRQLVELHGGTITGASDGLGTGATFTVTLPLMFARPDRQPPVGPIAATAPRALADLTAVRVLAVDDDADALTMVRDILEAAGATVTTASDAGSAYAELMAGSPDVLIADLGMPIVDGFQLIDRVRKSDDVGTRTVPAVALTAYARSEDRLRAISAGFQMHLAKPIDPVKLVDAVRALSRRAPRS
jgi:CheY-like chemotaxis protein